MFIEYFNTTKLYILGKLALPAQISIFILLGPENFYTFALCVAIVAFLVMVTDPGLSIYRLSNSTRVHDTLARLIMYLLAITVVITVVILNSSDLLMFDAVIINSVCIIFLLSVANIDIKVKFQQKNEINVFVKKEQVGKILFSTAALLLAFNNHVIFAIIVTLASSYAPLIYWKVLLVKKDKLKVSWIKCKDIIKFSSGIFIHKIIIYSRKHFDKFSIPFFFHSYEAGQIFFTIMIIETIRMQVNNIFVVNQESVFSSLSRSEFIRQFIGTLYLQQLFMLLMVIVVTNGCLLIKIFEPAILENWTLSVELLLVYIANLAIFSVTGSYGGFLMLSGNHKTLNLNLFVFGVLLTAVCCLPGLLLTNPVYFVMGLLVGHLLQKSYLLMSMLTEFNISVVKLFKILRLPFFILCYCSFSFLFKNYYSVIVFVSCLTFIFCIFSLDKLRLSK